MTNLNKFGFLLLSLSFFSEGVCAEQPKLSLTNGFSHNLQQGLLNQDDLELVTVQPASSSGLNISDAGAKGDAAETNSECLGTCFKKVRDCFGKSRIKYDKVANTTATYFENHPGVRVPFDMASFTGASIVGSNYFRGDDIITGILSHVAGGRVQAGMRHLNLPLPVELAFYGAVLYGFFEMDVATYPETPIPPTPKPPFFNTTIPTPSPNYYFDSAHGFVSGMSGVAFFAIVNRLRRMAEERDHLHKD